MKISLLLLLSLCFFSCNTPSEPTAFTSEKEARVSTNDVAFTLRLETTRMSVTDTLKGSFEVWNRSSQEQTFVFGNQQQLGLEIQQGNGEIIFVSPLIVQPAPSGFKLQPNTRREYLIRLLSRNNRDGGPLPTGSYLLNAYLLALLEGNSPRVALPIRIE